MGKIIKLGVTLGVFCVISAGMLAYVFMMTGPRIEANAKASFDGSLREVLPGAESFKSVAAPGAKSEIYEGYAGARRWGLRSRSLPGATAARS